MTAPLGGPCSTVGFDVARIVNPVSRVGSANGIGGIGGIGAPARLTPMCRAAAA